MTTSVAYQGLPGAFGEEAIIGFFGADAVTPAPMPTFSAVCSAVESGEVAAGVLPLENSVAGTVGDALDALADGALRVVGELVMPVRHHLLALPGVRLEEIERATSHWQALSQCERFLAGHSWAVLPAADTAGAARDLAEAGDRSTAAIASERAAERYGLAVLAANVHDVDHNLTRFAVLAPERGGAPLPPAVGPLAPPSGAARATLLTFETGHRPGDLYRALGAFADAGVNLSRIESRPSGTVAWKYRFLVQVEGDEAGEPLAGALATLRDRTRSLRVLGSFDVAPEGA
jgi:prephenate dehydratase